MSQTIKQRSQKLHGVWIWTVWARNLALPLTEQA